MIQIQGRHIRSCGAILAAALLGVAGTQVAGAPASSGDGGPAVSAPGGGKAASRGGRSAGRGKAASRGGRSAGRGKAASRGGRSAGRGKQAPPRSGKSAGRTTGSRKSGRDARPAPRQPQRPKANRGTQRREAGRPARTPETRSKGVPKSGGRRDVRSPSRRPEPPGSTRPGRVIVTRPGDGERPSVRTPRVDPGKAPDRRRINSAPKRPSGTNREPKVVDDRGPGERRVRIVRLDEGSKDRRTPRLGPGVTEGKGPTTTITYRPDPADDERPITQSIPRRLPGDAGGTTTSPRRPSGTGARPRVSIGDPGPNDGGGGSTKGGKGGRGKKGGQQGRHKGDGHKRHHKHHDRRDRRCDSCSLWYWGSLWCYPGYRYGLYWGWPSYGYWPYYGRYGYRYGSWYGYWPHDYGYGYSSYDYATQPAYTDYADTSYVGVVYAPEPCPRTLAEGWGLLADGRPGEAADAFDCLAEAIPDDGLPLVGYALAAALLDEHEVAVANMREALRADPETLRYVPEDERLHGQLTQLVEHYEYRARHQYGDLDALFMVASLRYLLNQERAAHYAIDIAASLGDNDPSTVSLRLLIESALE